METLICSRSKRLILLLQWGHASSRVETGWKIKLPHPVVAPLQWGHASSRVETVTHRPRSHPARLRFNGATRLHAWKRSDQSPARYLVPRFNGATRLHAWKLDAPFNRIQGPDALQWGHASSRVETIEIIEFILSLACRFNGATRLHAWKRRR